MVNSVRAQGYTADISANMPAYETISPYPRSELDSHANMVVLGKHAFIFESSGRTCNVRPFSDELGIAENVPIVDGAIAYDCPFSSKSYILLFRNALSIPTMESNLIPPFIMRMGGVVVNDTPKIHCMNPSTEDHCLTFKDSDLRIPMQLMGTFSFFHCRMPSADELESCDKIFLTPDSTDWNPHCESFAKNEESMLDYEGNMAESRRVLRNVMQREPVEHNDPNYELSAVSGEKWDEWIDQNADEAFEADDPTFEGCLDQDVANLARAMNLRGEISKISGSLGSTTMSTTASDDLFELDNPFLSTLDEMEMDFSKDIKGTVSAAHAEKPKGISSETLSKLWNIREDLAQGAIDATTQLNRQSADNTLSRNFSTNDRMLRYRRINSTFYTDTMFATSKAKSTRGNKCCQVFVSDKGFVAVYPMKTPSQFEEALHLFCKEIGVPVNLVADPHPSQTKGTVRRFCDQVGTTLRLLEKSTQWANRAELYIGLLKEAVRKDMRASNAPMVLWDYCIQRRAKIHNVTPRNLFQNDGLAPFTATFGVQDDISNICNFGWCEWVYYRDHGIFPINKEKLGKVLGPLKNEGNEMAQAVLTHNGKIIPRRTIRHLKTSEIHNPIEKTKRDHFDEEIRKKLGNATIFPPKPLATDFVSYSDSETDPTEIIEDQDPLDDNGSPKFESPITDYLIHSEIHLPQGEEMRAAKVLRRSRNEDGEIVGTHNENPLMNTLVYDVEFPDGEVREYSANILAENMYAQVDADGHTHTMLDSIIDYSKDGNAVSKEDGYVITKRGRKRRRMTTAGWMLNVLWKDGSEQWIPLAIMKESHPLETADFAVSRNINDEPAFAWWTPFILRKRDRVISGMIARVKKVTHKYGVELPTTVQEAFDLDKKNGNTLWRDALTKEMENLKVAFDILERGQAPPPGYKKASGHIIFDVRMTLERKARWVKDGHKTPQPDNCTYAGVVSRESVRIALTSAALNGLPVCACDIQNAYLQAPSSEKHYIKCGREFGIENEGKLAVIVRALYGGKSAGADYWRHVRSAMTHMNFKPCTADPDVWIRPGVKADGLTYWQYVLLYTDDILAIMEEPEKFIREELGHYFKVKENSIGPPTQYLGNKVSQVTMENGVKCWSFSSSQYVQNAIKNVEDYLAKSDSKLPARAKSPWTSNYRPEIDITPELIPVKAAYYQSLIGVLRWIVELGRGDICMEVSAMASMMALPREGHLDQLFHMFAFLKTNHNGVMVFDPTEPDIDSSCFVREDWSAAAYGECEEELPPNMPEPRGVQMTMRAFVDSDHAGDTTTRRSRTGFIIFLNNAPIYWFSKKQTSVETSSFGSEFIAMKQCCEYIRGLRYKLRMMGIPVGSPTFVFGDNQSVLANTTRPHSILRKKSASIAYHFVREGVAKDEWRTTYLNTHLNPSDLMTKSLPGGEKRTRFTAYFLHYLG